MWGAFFKSFKNPFTHYYYHDIISVQDKTNQPRLQKKG
ncbi:hypothetical protein DB29_0P0016 (plasmid) [Shouchella clausii]|nr:hypothetical protein DB29_0P0016 [Shouchella clausii]